MRLAHACLILLSCLATAIDASAQLGFALGSSSSDDARGIAVDTAGNIFVTGAFNGTVDFDPGAGLFELDAGIGESAFVAAYAADGSFRYAVAFPGEGEALAVDPVGNVYATGTLRGGAADVDPGPGELLLIPSAGRVFLVSYDPLGNLRFGINVGGGVSNLLESGYSLDLDANSNVFLTGVINGETDFDPTPEGELLFPVDGFTDGFVASYTNQGGLRHAFTLGGKFTDLGYGIAVDGAGRCYVTGAFRDSLDFDPGPMTDWQVAAGDQDIFLASYTNGGSHRFSLVAGGSGTEVGRGIAVDDAGNSYLTGFVRGDTDFDPGSGLAIVTPGPGDDAFLASYTPGGTFRFAFGLGNNNAVQGLAVAVGSNGGPQVAGYFSNVLDFDPGPGTSTLSGVQDAFVAAYDSSGAYRFAYNFPDVGLSASDEGRGIAIGPVGRTHVVGSFGGTMDVDPSAGTLLVSSHGALDALVVRSGSAVVAADPWGPVTSLNLRLGPNPATGTARLRLTSGASGRLQIDLYDIAGRRVARLGDATVVAGQLSVLEIPLRDLSNGVYLVRASLGNSVASRKLHVVR